MDTQTLIRKLQTSARNVANARNRAQRDAAQTFLIARAGELVARRDDLLGNLDARWTWLDANDPGVPYADGHHDDRFVRREQRTIDLLHEYEAICDALDDAKAAWLHDTMEAI